MRTHSSERKMEEKVELIQLSEREIMVGKNRLFLDECEIMHIVNVGDIHDETAILFEEAILKLAYKVDGKMKVLQDINRMRKPTPGARKRVQELSKNEKFGKTAVFGMHPVAKVLASFIGSLMKKKDLRFFKTKEEALAWLKEK